MSSEPQIHNTFGLPASADRYLVFSNESDLRQSLASGWLQQPCFVLGGGSNVVFAHHYAGTILHLQNKGIRLLPSPTQSDDLMVEAAAGEEWDPFVRHCIANGWHGAENLVAIPGTVGAAPVQNVGAYGVEAKDIIHSVRAFELATGQERIFTNAQCQFAYRQSIFKNALAGRYVIWSVTFRLHRSFVPNLHYQALADALLSLGAPHPSPSQLADTITAVRWSKLPRPEEIGSAGSFFKNPVVTPQHYQILRNAFPNIVAHPVAEGYKLSAGWLIERAGWKGRNLGRCGVYEKQALVLVNRGGCTGQEVLALAQAVTHSVHQLFGITLEPEAIII